MPDIDKQKLSLSFSRAAAHYDAIASFQQQVAARLAQLLPAIPATCILDGGCGTGASSALLTQHWPDALLLACDLSPEMARLAHARQLTAVCGDLEQLPFSKACFDVAWSSLALQWCRPQLAYPELQRVLKPGGQLLFSTLTSGSLHELESTFGGIDRHKRVLPFASEIEIVDALHAAGFENVQCQAERWVTQHADLKTLLTSIRGIGANQTGAARRPGMMGKTQWQAAQARYENLRDADGMLPLTYSLLFVSAEKSPAQD